MIVRHLGLLYTYANGCIYVYNASRERALKSSLGLPASDSDDISVERWRKAQGVPKGLVIKRGLIEYL